MSDVAFNSEETKNELEQPMQDGVDVLRRRAWEQARALSGYLITFERVFGRKPPVAVPDAVASPPLTPAQTRDLSTVLGKLADLAQGWGKWANDNINSNNNNPVPLTINTDGELQILLDAVANFLPDPYDLYAALTTGGGSGGGPPVNINPTH